MKKTILLLVLLVIPLALAACTAGPNELRNTPDEDGDVAGFWKGIWHGLISPITFVLSLFTKNIYVFEVHNNGGWYTFGFLLGAHFPPFPPAAGFFGKQPYRFGKDGRIPPFSSWYMASALVPPGDVTMF